MKAITLTRELLVLATACTLLAGCGLKGDLYLEEEQPEATEAEAAAEPDEIPAAN